MSGNESGVDLFVIGAGSGGVRAARMAAAAGATVAIAEEARLGGTCVNVGCVPKKLLVYAAHFRDEVEDAAGFGWRATLPPFDWPTLIHNKDAEIERLNGIYRRLLLDAGVRILAGRARLDARDRVVVGSETVTAARVLLATGGRPRRPDIPGAELGLVSDDVFALASQPRRIVIVGGGYIAVEFAGVFEGLGSEVTLVYRGDRILRGFDTDLRDGLTEALLGRGIELRTERHVAALRRAADGIVATLDDGAVVEADAVLFAIGRDPNTSGIGLDAAGVELDAGGAIRVDALSETSAPGIYAIGDCTDRMNLTPVAIAEAMAFVDTVYRDRPRGMDYENVPTAVFSQPCLATVGLTEGDARERLGAVDVYRSRFRPLKATLSGSTERTLVKLVVDRASDRVVGAHMLGPDAAEIIQGIAVAIKAGASKAEFDATVGIHPTTAEEFVTLRDPAP
ncbi:MAG: glutathione-disulfide reductase [Thermoanaerobaculia bacterium]|nr:glutathione-disulfide reductase [Thermoanaerobaculia bacterium]